MSTMQASFTLKRLSADRASDGSTLRFFRSGGPAANGSPADLRLRLGGAGGSVPTTPDSSVSTLSRDGDEKDTATSRRHIGGLLRKGGMVPGQTALLLLSHSKTTPDRLVGTASCCRYAGRASRTCTLGEGVQPYKRPRLGSTVRDLHFSRAKALQYPTGRPRLDHAMLFDSSWLTRLCRHRAMPRPVHVVVDDVQVVE